MDEARGSGRTTKQMIDAPWNAIFVWCNEFWIDGAKKLAKKAGRDDLEIIRPSALEDRERFRGREISGVVVDHAAKLTAKQVLGHLHLTVMIR